MSRIVYLLHFDPPFKHAQHYIGVTRNSLARRLRDHLTGRGANLTRHAKRAGCLMILTRIWPAADFGLEVRLKKRGGASRICPVCRRRRRRAAARSPSPD